MRLYFDIIQRDSEISVQRRALLIAIVSAYAVLWIGGITHHWLIGKMGPEKNWLASIFLFLAGAVIFACCKSLADFAVLVSVSLMGFAVEFVGVWFGVPFGDYVYTDVLKPQVFKVPLAMAFAWVILFAYVKQMLLKINLPKWAEPVVAAFWMTGIDLMIDPLAVKQLGYWEWSGSGFYYDIPMSNFAGWFVTSLFIFIIFRRRLESDTLARYIGFSVLLFFTLISLAYAFFLAALIGLILLSIHVVIIRRQSGLITESARKLNMGRQ